jgi:hypothetical protein
MGWSCTWSVRAASSSAVSPRGVRGGRWVPEHRDPCSLRDSSAQELEPFAIEVGQLQGQAGDVPTGPGEAGDVAGFEGIGMPEEDDGDRSGRLFRPLHKYGAPRHDQVHLEPHQLGRELWEPRDVVLRPAGFDPQVLAFAPAALPQGEPKDLPQPRFRRVGGCQPQDPDAGHFPRLRRCGGERRQEEGKGQRRDAPNGRESHGHLLL